MTQYIHGFDERERARLLEQGKILAPLIYSDVEFGNRRSILEVGSGVGAQTLQLLSRFPKAHITCVELSAVQLGTARKVLRKPIQSGRVTLVQASADRMPFRSRSFDAAFVCWLLEHVPDPARVLREVARVSKKGAPLYAREVFNRLWYTSPANPFLDRYWIDFNARQHKMDGDPYVGIRLGVLLQKAGFKEIDVAFRTSVVDRRDPRRKREMMDYWRDLFLSGDTAKGSVQKKIMREFARLTRNPESAMFFGFAAIQAVRK